MERVDYVDTFIAVAEDCPVVRGTPPPVQADNPSIAARTYRMIAERPYELTSGDVLFTVHAERHGIPEEDRPDARASFYSKGQPCLRSSDLGKRYGWGIHADSHCRVALYSVDNPEYAEFVSGRRRTDSGEPVTLTKAMRGARARR